ncbi:M20/M25/M40 family metallo-hydrolase [Bacteroidota bacterium]
MKKIIIILFIAFIGLNFFSCSKPENEVKPGINSITSSELMETVNYLSSDNLKGRLSGSEGYDKAAEFMADQFKSLGLSPAIGDDYMQYLKVEYNEITAPCELNLMEDNGNETEFYLGEHFVCRGFTGSGNFTAPVAFCGYGISRPDIGYDDYKDIDVKGKVVMVFKYNPNWTINENVWSTNYPREKSFTAAQHGAVGILFVSAPNNEPVQPTIGSILAGKGEQNENFPQLHIDVPVAEKFLTSSEKSLSQLQTIIDESKKPASFSLTSNAKININANYTKEKTTENVAALLEGSDPELKNEYLVIGAHLDHVGSQGDEIIFPGANDNASGSAAVLEIAEAFIESCVQPKRSILFVLFASEELGLNGAYHFVENSPVPIENIVAMLNLDCISIGDSIRVGGGGISKNLWALANSEDEKLSDMMISETWPGGGADATPFFEKDIPTLFFVTTNGYAHLHYMTDKPETLEPDLFEKVVKLAYVTSYEIAMGNYDKENLER